MGYSSHQKVHTILKKLDAQSASNVVTLFDNSVANSNSFVSVNGFLKNLKAYSKISSLPSVRLPNLRLEDSETEKLYKTLDIEFNSPRKQLDIVINENNGEWLELGSVSLLNPSGYPYRMFNLLDFFTDGLAYEIGLNTKVGVRVKNVGHGLLEANDLITIHGSAVQEFVSESQSLEVIGGNIQPIQDSIMTVLGNEFTINEFIITARQNRKYLIIEAKSDFLIEFNQVHSIEILSGGSFDIANYPKPIQLSGNGINAIVHEFF